MWIFGDMESQPKLPFITVTMADVSARKATTSSAGMMAARFRIMRTPFYSDQAFS